MDLTTLEEIYVDSVSRELINDVHELARQIENARPLADDVVMRVERELLGEQVYNSNAIEGNRLTLRETRAILQAGQIVDVGRQREGQEAINLGRAITELQQLVTRDDAFADKLSFLAIHATLFSELNPDRAGRYRDGSVMIRGAKFQPPAAEEIPGLMGSLFAQLRAVQGVDPVVTASWAHWAVARIHPFYDGNGRMARLWQDLIFFCNGLVPAVIRQQDRTEYYKSLESADSGEFDPLLQLVTRSLSGTLQIYVNALQEEDVVSGWAAEIVGEVHDRIDDQRKLEYARWSRQMIALRDAFERCAIQINKASGGQLFIEIHRYTLIEQSTWETLRAGTGASKTWFFRIFARRDDLTAHYIFFFGHHFSSEADSQIGNVGPAACLLVSEQVGDENVKLFELEDAPITLRELLAIDNQLVRKKWDPANGKEVYDAGVSPLVVAQEFLKEMVYQRLT